jgi:hypothetical protein
MINKIKRLIFVVMLSYLSVVYVVAQSSIEVSRFTRIQYVLINDFGLTKNHMYYDNIRKEYRSGWDDKTTNCKVEIFIRDCLSPFEANYEENHSAAETPSTGSGWGEMLGDYSEYGCNSRVYGQFIVNKNTIISVVYIGESVNTTRVKLITDTVLKCIESSESSTDRKRNVSRDYLIDATKYSKSVKTPILKALSGYMETTSRNVIWSYDSTVSRDAQRLELKNPQGDSITLDIISIDTVEINPQNFKYKPGVYKGNNIDYYIADPFISDVVTLSSVDIHPSLKQDILCTFFKKNYIVRLYYHDHQKLDKEQVTQLVKTIYKSIEL